MGLPVVATRNALNNRFVLLELSGSLTPLYEDFVSDTTSDKDQRDTCAPHFLSLPQTESIIDLVSVGRLSIKPIKQNNQVASYEIYLYIGSKILKGHLKPLTKPFLCCQPSCENVSSLTISSLEESDMPSLTTYGIVREKIVFDTRPITQWI